jgi:hypothetical protein
MNAWGWIALFFGIVASGIVINLVLIRRVWRSGKRLLSEISAIRGHVKRQ